MAKYPVRRMSSRDLRLAKMMEDYGVSPPAQTIAGSARLAGGGALTPHTATARPELGQIYDPRLRGISLQNQAASGSRSHGPGYDIAAARFRMSRGDPYEELARRELEIGRRQPLPYAAPSALAGTLPMSPEYYQSQYEDLHNTHATVNSGSMAGRRTTAWGTLGEVTPQSIPFSARDQFGAKAGGGRGGPGLAPEWDLGNNRERRSGRMTSPTRFSQRVDPRYPFLHLVALGVTSSGGLNYDGNAHMRVRAGNFDTGGAQLTREFFLGGRAARFDVNGFDQCEITIIDLLDNTNVQFMWVTNGLQVGDPFLIFPQRITAGVSIPVPEGAQYLILEDPALGVPATTADVVWTTALAGPGTVPITIEVDDGSSGSANQFGRRLGVYGTTVTITSGAVAAFDVVWLLEPI